MKYEKAVADVLIFENNDVITTSGCDKGNSNSCSHNTSGKQCFNSNQGTAENCPQMNHGSMNGQSDYFGF